MQTRICSLCQRQYRDVHNALSIVLTGYCIDCLRDKDDTARWESEGGR